MQLSGSGEMGRVERDSVIYVVNECVVWLYHPPYTRYIILTATPLFLLAIQS